MPMPLLSNQWRGNRVCLFVWSLGMWISYSTPLTCLILLYEYESRTVSKAGAVLISSSVVQNQSKSHITVQSTHSQHGSSQHQPSNRKEKKISFVMCFLWWLVRLVQIECNQMANKRSVGACLRWVDLARPNSTRTDWNTLGANVWCGHVQVQLLEKGFSCLFQRHITIDDIELNHASISKLPALIFGWIGYSSISFNILIPSRKETSCLRVS